MCDAFDVNTPFGHRDPKDRPPNRAASVVDLLPAGRSTRQRIRASHVNQEEGRDFADLGEDSARPQLSTAGGS
jgi:hypothetical protein